MEGRESSSLSYTQRKLWMMKEYLKLHDDGLSVKEIAERFNLSFSTVYRSLDEIAKMTGRTRLSLLPHPNMSITGRLGCTRQFEQVDTDKILHSIDTMLVEIDSIHEAVVSHMKYGKEAI